jgi:hypothetical protein
MLTISKAKAIIKDSAWYTVMLTPPRRSGAADSSRISLRKLYHITIDKTNIYSINGLPNFEALALLSGAFSICEKVENFMQYLYRGLHTSIEVSKELCYNIF